MLTTVASRNTKKAGTTATAKTFHRYAIGGHSKTRRLNEGDRIGSTRVDRSICRLAWSRDLPLSSGTRTSTSHRVDVTRHEDVAMGARRHLWMTATDCLCRGPMRTPLARPCVAYELDAEMMQETIKGCVPED